jgi:hypothetical protein
MAYLDDRQRLNKWIAVMTIPAIVFLFQRFLETSGALDGSSLMSALHETQPLIGGLAAISPLFVLIQLSMIVTGTASKTWQNFLCVILTAVAALLAWRGTTMAIG